MTYQANPFDAMGQSFNALQGAWDQGTRNKAGRAYAAGDMEGASNALGMGGMIPEAQAMRGQMRADEDRARGTQMTEALRGGDMPGAQALARTPEELAQLQEFAANATKAERDAAAANAGRMAAVAEAVKQLPAEQQRAAVLQYAQQFGVDPAQIPEQISPEWIEGIRVQALGLEEYLKFKDREADNQRPIATPFGIYMPPGTPASAMPGQQAPRSLGPAIPQGWSAEPPRPNQPPSAPAAGGGERSQTPRVSFRSSQEAQSAIQQIVPGVRVTSGARDAASNRRVGGAPGSFHLQDRARDLVPPTGMSMAQLAAKMRQAGFRVLNEGDHVHVSW